MNKKEISAVIQQKLEPYFIERGFQSFKTGQDVLFQYSKKDDTYAYSAGGYLLKHVNHKLVYGFSFGINKIVDILKDIDRNVKLQKGLYTIAPTFINVSPGYILFPKETERPYKSFSDEFELELCLFDIQAFYQSYFEPFCEKNKNLGRLDKLFNRLDDFRIDSSFFPGLSFFHITRLIIARLAENPDYEKVVEKNFDSLEYLWEKEGGKYDRLDESKPEVFAAKYLRDLKI